MLRFGFLATLLAMLTAMPAGAVSVYAEAAIDPPGDGTPPTEIEQRFTANTLAEVVFGSSSAAAQTTFGTSRARALASDVSANEAIALSEWIDFLVMDGTAPVGGVLTVEFSIDGSWANHGEFEFIAGIYSGVFEHNWEGAWTSRAGPFVRYANCGSVFGFCADRDTNAMPSVLVPGTGDAAGSFDLTFTLSVPWVAGERVGLVGSLYALGRVEDGASMDAFSSAVVREIRIPAGTSLTSEAGALEAYRVRTVPEANAITLVSLALGLLIGRAGVGKVGSRR